MTFGSTFGRTFSPTFQPKSQAAVASSWWLAGGIAAANCVAAYQPIGAASYAASLVDLSGSDNDASEGAAPDWNTNTGWDFVTVSNKYLNTGIAVTSNMSIVIRFSDAKSTGDNYLFGLTTQSSGKEYWIAPNNQYFTKIKYARFDRQDSVSSKITSGVVALAVNKLYVNGSLDVTAGAGELPISSSLIVIGRQKPTYGDPVAIIQAIAIYSTDISSYIANLTTAMNAL